MYSVDRLELQVEVIHIATQRVDEHKHLERAAGYEGELI